MEIQLGIIAFFSLLIFVIVRQNIKVYNHNNEAYNKLLKWKNEIEAKNEMLELRITMLKSLQQAIVGAKTSKFHNDDKAEIIAAPFSAEQILLLNNHQSSSTKHPYTCNGQKGICGNIENEPGRILYAVRGGLLCKCGMTLQNWAHNPLINS